MMKTIRIASLTFALIFGLLFHVASQDIKWDTTPRKGFVFKIDNREAQKLLTISSPDTIFNGLLHTLVDTFDVEKGWINRPQKGHFILARIIENKLHCEYISIFPYQVFLLKEYDALALQVLDLDGNLREDAKVKFKLKRLRIDPDSKTYRIDNTWFNGTHRIVTVELDGFRSVFNVQKHEVPSWYNNNYNNDGPSFYSYMITDKNKYKPNDRIRFKSYALSHSRSPIRRDLQLWLVSSGKSINAGVVSPHRPGSYAGSIQLHDSLKLILDKYYSIQLREKSGRVVATCNFKYEDYELHGNKLEVKLTKTKQFRPEANELIINATDVNGLRLKDARAGILIKTRTIRETFQPLVILRDTLMFKEIDLDPDSSTVVSIPSSLFLKTNAAYDVIVAVVNSQNQRMEQTVSASYYYTQYEIKAGFSNDSIIYEMLNNSVPMHNVPVQLFHDDEIKGKQVLLPYKEKINPVISTVRLNGELVSRMISMRDLIPRLGIGGGIQKDSFNIFLRNPQQLEVSWYVYQGSELLQKGFGREIEYKSVITDRTQTYYVEILYSFGGEDNIKRWDYEFREDVLNVSLDIPERVYPGQQVDATIHVSDQLGHPVSGVDLTAVGVTAKLNYYLPDLPYYGSSSTPRSKKAHYSKDDINKRTAVLDLDYRKWEKLARLDTMKYYQFTYPLSRQFKHTIAIPDSTQFAPYVMQHGSAKAIFVVEVNRLPVYYAWVDQPKNYSFYIAPFRKQEITLRLHDRVLILDSIACEAGKKTILSIDLDHLPKGVKVHSLPGVTVNAGRRQKRIYYSFTQTEKNRHQGYVSSFKAEMGAYLESGNGFTPLFNGEPPNKAIIVAGPIMPGRQTYTANRTFSTTYRHTGGYNYAFEDNIVYKMNAGKLIPDYLYDNVSNPMMTINDLEMTKDKFLEPKNDTDPKWHTRVISLVDHATRISILLPDEKEASGIATFLFENCRTKEMTSPCQNRSDSFYRNSRADFYTIPRGWHHAIVLYNNGTYLKMDSIYLQSNSHVVADMNNIALHPADSLSEKWLSMPAGNCYKYVAAPSKTIPLSYRTHGIGNVRGIIYDEMNLPLPGVNVVVKGTTIGTSTEINGQFSLDIPESTVVLVLSFIGYATKELEVQLGSQLSVHLEPDVQHLSEVVVMGYGTTSKSQLSYSLSGRVAGVTISAPDKNEPEVEIEEEEDKITREAEQHLYQELLTLNTIRSNFSDVGLWEPRLYTDKRGQSKFTVTFPDDITRWNATVYAMNRYLQTGTTRKSIRSYKPLMAELHVPQFLTRGDSAEFLGKVLNYTNDKNITGRVTWSGARSDFEKDIAFTDYHTDKLPVYAVSTDSITASYRFTRDDGYLDGEARTVPVVEQGIFRADGTLSILKNKDSLYVKASEKEIVTIEILNNQLDIYTGEVRYLLNYKYACNEQLASKLLGLVNHRMLMQYEGKPFRYDKDVNKIIARLLKNQNQEFLWSWWDVSSATSYWMSAHILRALKAASDAGYKVELDIENIARKASYKFDFLHQYSLYDADLLHALASWGAKLDYSKYIHTLDTLIQRMETINPMRRQYYRYSLLKEKFLLQETRQLANLQYQRDTLLRYRREGIMGDVHFSDERAVRYWYNDDLSTNAIAYRIVKRDSLLKDLLVPMQLYFLSERRKGEWNTYHSSNVLMSVLPDFLAEGASKGHTASVSLSGGMNGTIAEFPYRVELQPGEELHIRKESGLPLYFMKYVKERVTVAKTGVEGFAIKTYFANEQLRFEAGKPVTMSVEVDVQKDAAFEYVMIEVPIPGTCSYADKRQYNNPIETHREYFKEGTVIFCERMKAGKYIFQIQLLPRFTGKYLINPAQVSLMYVPVVNANTDMKAVKVAN